MPRIMKTKMQPELIIAGRFMQRPAVLLKYVNIHAQSAHGQSDMATIPTRPDDCDR